MTPDKEWIGLGEAAGLMGVHPATVRAWADRGELAAQRTPGGHRRFRRSDVVARAAAQARRQGASAQLVVQNVIGRARLEFAEGNLHRESWYQVLDGQARQELRGSGHRLLQLVAHHLTSDETDAGVWVEARRIGESYADLGRRFGLSLSATVRAYLFFRGFLTETVFDMAETAGWQGPTDWARIRRQVIELTDQILLAMIASHEAGPIS